MKKVFAFSIIAALLSMAACNKTALNTDVETPVVKAENGMLVVSVNPNNGSSTKADGTTIDGAHAEDAITSLQVFVFFDATVPALGQTAGAKETDKFATFTGTDNNRTITLTTTTGMKRIYALANAPRLDNVTSEDDLKGRVMNLGSNYIEQQSDGRIGLVMAGAYGYASTDAAINVAAAAKEVGAYVQGSDASITSVPISLNRLSARVEIQNVNVDFRGTWLEGLNFTIKEIYLKNVPNGVYFYGQNSALLATAGYWTNKISHETNPVDNAGNGVSKLVYEQRASGGTSCNVAGTDTYIGSYFYTYPNPTTTDQTGSSWSQRRTRLVIHAQVSGSNSYGTNIDTPRDVYYPISIAAPENFVSSGSTAPTTSPTHTQIVGNHKYVINKITITQLGRPDDGDEPIVSGKAKVEVTVQDWNGTTVLGYEI